MFNTFEHRIDFLSNAHKMLTDLQECPHIGSVVLGSALTFVSWGSASCGSVS